MENRLAILFCIFIHYVFNDIMIYDKWNNHWIVIIINMTQVVYEYVSIKIRNI